MTDVTGNKLNPDELTPEVLSTASHAQLSTLRDQIKDPVKQQLIAPYEHRAFAREYVGDANPIESAAKAVGLTAAIPAYQLKKAIAPQEGETPPSLAQATEGMKGVAEGLGEPWKRVWNNGVNAVTATVDQATALGAKAVETVRMPWDRVWGVSSTIPSKLAVEASSAIVAPSVVPVKTEKQMTAAVKILPHEVQPDTRSIASNLEELDRELKNTKNPSVIKILTEERNRLIAQR